MPVHWLANLPVINLSPRSLLSGDVTPRSVVTFAEALLWRSMDFVFAPRTWLKQLFYAAALQSAVAVVLQARRAAGGLVARLFPRSRRGQLHLLQVELANAPTYARWLDAAKWHDHLTGMDKWRLSPESHLYDYQTVAARTAELEVFLDRVSGKGHDNMGAEASSRNGHGSSRHRSGSLRSGRRGHSSNSGSARGGFTALSSSWDDLPEMARSDTQHYAPAAAAGVGGAWNKGGNGGEHGNDNSSSASGRSHRARRASVSRGSLRSEGGRAKSDGASSNDWPDSKNSTSTSSSSSSSSSNRAKHGAKRAQSSSSLKMEAQFSSTGAAASAGTGVVSGGGGASRDLRRSSSGNGRGSNSRLAEQDPITQELFALMFRVRGGLSRHDFGLLHEGLFAKARCGTKRAVERYYTALTRALGRLAGMPPLPALGGGAVRVGSRARALDALQDDYSDNGPHHTGDGGHTREDREGNGSGNGSTVAAASASATPPLSSKSTSDEDAAYPRDNIPTEVKLAFFNEMRHAYGRTALMLSGGAVLGLYHVGVAKALFAAGLLPRVLSGASAGAIVAATLATKSNEELVATRVFEGEGVPLEFFRVNERSSNGVYLETATLRKTIQGCVGHETFQEAFDRTGRILNVMVAPVNSRAPARLLNYLTAPHVLIWSAALASSAVPGVFEPVPLLVREPDGALVPEDDADGFGRVVLYQDGSMDADLPTQQLSELFNVNHFIVSQANPHSVFLSSLGFSATSAVWKYPALSVAAGALLFIKDQTRAWLNNVVNVIAEVLGLPRSILTRGVLQILLQTYEGRDNVDITIFPWRGAVSELHAITNLFTNPGPERYRQMIAASERNTWGRLPQVKAHCEVEVCLERCVQHLRKQLLADARHASTSSKVPATTASSETTPTSARSKTGVNYSRGVFPDHQDHLKGGGSGSNRTMLEGEVLSGVAPLTPGTAAGVVDIGVAGTGSSRDSGGGGGTSSGTGSSSSRNWNNSSSSGGTREPPKKGLSRVPSFFTSKSQSDLQRSAAEALREEQKQAAAAAVEREVAALQAERKAEQAAEKLARERQALAWQQTRENARAAAAGNKCSLDQDSSSSSSAIAGDGGANFAATSESLAAAGQASRDESLSSAGLTVGDEYFAPLKRSTTPTPHPPPPLSSGDEWANLGRSNHSGSHSVNHSNINSPLSGKGSSNSSRSMKCPAPFFSGHSVVDTAPSLLPSAHSPDHNNSPTMATSNTTANGASSLRSPRAANWSWYGNDPLPANHRDDNHDVGGSSSSSSTEEEESGEEAVGRE